MPFDLNTLTQVNNDSHIMEHFIKTYWPVVFAVIGFIVSILVMVRGKIPLIENRVKDLFVKVNRLENENFIGEDTIYDINHNHKFISVLACDAKRGDCMLHQQNYHDTFCKKLDVISSELKAIVRDADAKRESTRNEITIMNKSLITTMTQMKTILARDRKEETAEMIKSVVKQVMIEVKNNKH